MTLPITIQNGQGMKNPDATGKSTINSLLEAAQAAGDSLTKVTQKAVDTVTPTIQEAGRLGRNGYHSIEDAVNCGFEVSKDGVSSLSTLAKEIKENPDKTIKKIKLTASEAAELGKKKATLAKDTAVNTFERRGEIWDAVKESMDHVVRNPTEVRDQAWKHTKEYCVGITNGVIHSLSDMHGHLDIGREEFVELELRLKKQSEEFVLLKSTEKLTNYNPNSSKDFFDVVLVGGDLFHQSLAQEIPSDVINAYELQYPRMAEQVSFREHFLSLDTDARKHIVGLLKGKLFEIQYVNYLNDGHLENGYTAVLAEKANQPGFDILVQGPDGHISQLIQAKATDSVEYVKKALERYPDIDVATTSEVHSELVMRGFGENVIDGGITRSSLMSDMQDGADAAEAHFSGPSVITLALLAFTSYSQEDLSNYEKTRQFGDRSGSYAVAYGAGVLAFYGASALLGDSDAAIKFVSMAASTFTRTVIGTGRRKVERRNLMRELVDNNESILNRLRVKNLPGYTAA
jgi:hypothetical protein